MWSFHQLTNYGSTNHSILDILDKADTAECLYFIQKVHNRLTDIDPPAVPKGACEAFYFDHEDLMIL